MMSIPIHNPTRAFRRGVARPIAGPALCGFILILGSCFGTEKANATPVKKLEQPHYILVMGQDNLLCKSLVGFYNQMLRNGEELTVWEDTLPERTKIGIEPLPQIKDAAYPYVVLYHATLFGEQQPRVIYFAEMTTGNEGVSKRELVLLKQNTGFEFTKSNKKIELINPEVAERIDLLPKFHSYDVGQHYLVKWPGFDFYVSEYKRLERERSLTIKSSDIIPVVVPEVQSVFTYDGSPLFVDRQYGDGGVIVVYRLKSPSSANDICYLAQSPSQFLLQHGVKK